MLTGGLVFLAGAIINAAAQNIAMLIIGRILLGTGVGFANQVNIKSLNYLLFLNFFFPFSFASFKCKFQFLSFQDLITYHWEICFYY